MFRLTRAAEIARENVLNPTSPTTRAEPDVALEVAAAEHEIDVRQRARRLADERLHPLAAELVAVAVEEDVHLLLDRQREEEIRVGAPEDRLGAPGAELAQPVETALRVGDDEVVLARIRAVVVVEAGVHAAELGQAHGHVAVVEDDRNPEPLAQRRRNAAEVRHRHGEDDDRVDVALALEDPLEVALPARRHPAPDRLADEPVGDSVVRRVLDAAQVAVALQPGDGVAREGERLGLAVGGIRLGAPPRALDGTPPVRRHDQIRAGLVHPLPELPPRGRAAVAEVEVHGGRDGEDLGRLHGRECVRSVLRSR